MFTWGKMNFLLKFFILTEFKIKLWRTKSFGCDL